MILLLQLDLAVQVHLARQEIRLVQSNLVGRVGQVNLKVTGSISATF